MGRMKLETTRSGNAIKVAAAQGCRRGLAAFEGMSPAAGETRPDQPLALQLWWAPDKKIYIQTIHELHWNNVERMSMKSEHVRNESLWLCAVHAWLWQHDTECNFHRQTICITSCQVLSLASAEISAGALRSCLSSLPSELKAGKRLELLPNCLTTVCRI